MRGEVFSDAFNIPIGADLFIEPAGELVKLVGGFVKKQAARVVASRLTVKVSCLVGVKVPTTHSVIWNLVAVLCQFSYPAFSCVEEVDDKFLLSKLGGALKEVHKLWASCLQDLTHFFGFTSVSF